MQDFELLSSGDEGLKISRLEVSKSLNSLKLVSAIF